MKNCHRCDVQLSFRNSFVWERKPVCKDCLRELKRNLVNERKKLEQNSDLDDNVMSGSSTDPAKFIYIMGASQAIVGMTSGFIAYMRGIQAPDTILIMNLIAVIPILSLITVWIYSTKNRESIETEGSSQFSNHFLKVPLSLQFLTPLLVPVGFYLFYAYPPIIKTGALYVLLAVAITCRGPRLFPT